jgi:predicted transcriptional regulator of viral defense system
MNIAEIVPKDNYMLYIKAEDGKAGLFDVKPYLESEVFAPLKDRGEFERIHNGKYFVEWDCGADLSADTIQARWEASSTDNAQQGAPADAEKRRG